MKGVLPRIGKSGNRQNLAWGPTGYSTVLQYRYYSTTVLQLYSCDSCSCATVVQSYSRAVPKIDCPLARKADKVH